MRKRKTGNPHKGWKKAAAASSHQKKPETVMEWLEQEGAVESVKYDEDTGLPYRCFTIDITRF